MKEIRLHITNKGIMAHWLETDGAFESKPDPEIVALFGSHIIPTPYYSTDKATMSKARAEIAKLNPGVIVSVS